MAWRWTARRVVISAFVIFHLSALMIWTMPNCAIKSQFLSPYRYYMLPLGLWQWWAIFAPDPIKNSLTLHAEVVDCKGMRYIHDFTRLVDLPWWQKIPRYRNCKFAANMAVDEYRAYREFSARHAVRQVGLDTAAFPVWVSLYFEMANTPPPGTGVADPMAAPLIHVLDRYQFESLKEVRP